MSQKHPDAGIEAAIAIVEQHKDLDRWLDDNRNSKNGCLAVLNSIQKDLRALPPASTDTDALVEAIKMAIGYLDDPTGGTHVQDMWAASSVLCTALVHHLQKESA